MIKSMTGFASRSGAKAPFSWGWELRSVNGRGLDLRLRVPDWVEGLEAGLRKRLGAAAARGNITCNLRLNREEGGGGLELNEDQLQALLVALQQIEARAMDAGVSLAPSKATDIVTMRGVLEQSSAEEDTAPLCTALLADFEAVIEDFDAMRAREGAALADVLSAQLTEVEALTSEAAGLLDQRQADMAASLRTNLSRILDNTDGAEPDRVAQELALIAVKSDITEEIDRLTAHVSAARELLGQGGPVGRKLDFLMQEFNREANTLCSKAQNKALTRVGLALKAVIDQMREQVQNVE
ncbi:YicC family protein [Sulfitobacter sp. JBTF-M27]|uniref:YicC family protein n=1 Tax=Sulfitobacter sediminilitoris TaxID=2698830 RepID=A0A6P0CDI9_9RHOB|nr:YicC/YloC family endoribonuclease [Sulfitobacter sediminilitoris]NEK23410.1 YicC family protein [Sulfitobacter sediminilitoris]